jgi:hypothetical protein
MHIGYWWENQKERDNQEDKDVGGWAVLESTGSIWLRIGTSGGLLWTQVWIDNNVFVSAIIESRGSIWYTRFYRKHLRLFFFLLQFGARLLILAASLCLESRWVAFDFVVVTKSSVPLRTGNIYFLLVSGCVEGTMKPWSLRHASLFSIQLRKLTS